MLVAEPDSDTANEFAWKLLDEARREMPTLVDEEEDARTVPRRSPVAEDAFRDTVPAFAAELVEAPPRTVPMFPSRVVAQAEQIAALAATHAAPVPRAEIRQPPPTFPPAPVVIVPLARTVRTPRRAQSVPVFAVLFVSAAVLAAGAVSLVYAIAL